MVKSGYLSFPKIVLAHWWSGEDDSIFLLLVTMVAVATPLKMKATKEGRNTAGEGGRVSWPKAIGYLFPNSSSGRKHPSCYGFGCL